MNATFQPVSTGLDHASVACELTQKRHIPFANFAPNKFNLYYHFHSLSHDMNNIFHKVLFHEFLPPYYILFWFVSSSKQDILSTPFIVTFDKQTLHTRP